MTSALSEKIAARPRPILPCQPIPAAGTLVRDAFDDIASVVFGIAVLHRLDYETASSLLRRLDRIKVRLLRDLKAQACREDFDPSVTQLRRGHPAVDELFARNRAGMEE